MRRLAATLWIVAVVMVSVTATRLAVGAVEEQQARAATSEELAAHYASLIAGCMDGRIIMWVDPHTGKDRAAFCDVHDVPVAE